MTKRRLCDTNIQISGAVVGNIQMQRQEEVIGAFFAAAHLSAQGKELQNGYIRLKGGGYQGMPGGFLGTGRKMIEDLPQAAEWVGDDDYEYGFNASESIYSSPFRPAASAFVESIVSPRKRLALLKSRKCDAAAAAETPREDRINSLPDECLYEIFRCLPRARDRFACASVCMRWLMLQSHIHRHELHSGQGRCKGGCPRDTGRTDGSGGFAQGAENVQRASEVTPEGVEEGSEESHGLLRDSGRGDGWVGSGRVGGGQPHRDEARVERQPQWAIGDLSRCLEGKKATDVRLFAVAVGTLARGGLGKLSIKGGPIGNMIKGVTDAGLSTIGVCCSALRRLSLWDCPNVGDEGLVAIGNGCRLLESLDLLKCEKVGDAGLKAIAKGCPLLSAINLESCTGAGDEGLKAVGNWCSSLLSLSVNDCGLIGDEGISAVGLGCKKLKKLKLEKLTVSDNGLAHLGAHCKSLIKLKLANLEACSEDGFMSFGKGAGLQQLRSLCISACSGITDQSLGRIATVCTNLKLFDLSHCQMVTDMGLKAFIQACPCLDSLQLERCNSISYSGLREALVYQEGKLKTLRLTKCNGLGDWGLFPNVLELTCHCLKSLLVTHCKGLGDGCLAMVGRCCPALEHLDLSGLADVSDEGVMALLQGGGKQLVTLNLSGCSKVSNMAVSAVARHCSSQIRSLVLDGCGKVGDSSLQLVAAECSGLQDLDASHTAITDAGVQALVSARGPCLETLALAGCVHLTDQCLPLIEQGCSSLWALNLKHCPRLTRPALNNLESHLWHCQLLCL